MSPTGTENLSRDKLQRILAAIGAKAADDSSQNMDVPEFDWRQPRYFTLEQLVKLKDFAEIAARAATEEFTRLYQGDCRVSVVSTGLHFSQTFGEEKEQPCYYIPFGMNSQSPIGALCIPKTTAFIWTGLVLGGTAPDGDADRELSKLEESFLLDIAAELVNAFAKIYGSQLHPDSRLLQDWSSVKLHGSEELFEITFESARTDSEDGGVQASFLMCCDKLESAAGEPASTNEKLSEAQIANAILEHLHRTPVTVRVRLGTTRLPFKDMVDLQVNDIVMLDKKISDTVDILIENRLLFAGYPAQSGGKHAIVIA